VIEKEGVVTWLLILLRTCLTGGGEPGANRIGDLAGTGGGRALRGSMISLNPMTFFGPWIVSISVRPRPEKLLLLLLESFQFGEGIEVSK
jgi:hypothetical protein